ncbi:MAG: hypothetical protein Q8Q11_03230 [bacterium]|nr:hypothetical protein [bacterium]MDZ4247708.1 hypothetical protein [Patescibacteria group bacterium]
MRYYVYADEDGTVTWCVGSLNELFHDPRDAAPLMNSAMAVARTQTQLDDGGTWELVETADGDHGILVVTAANGKIVDTTSLEPLTLHEVNASGISTRTGIRHGEEGFEPIDSSAEPIRTARPRPLAETAA